LKSAYYSHPKKPIPGWIKLGVVASASALAGGLAAAWWYRKTLSKLRNAGENDQNPDFRISSDTPEDEI
jgi:HAMP domain-containing protein